MAQISTELLDTMPVPPQCEPNSYEVRYDPIHRWPVIYAPGRANRPFDFNQRKPSGSDKHDPFIEGREAQTTAESLSIRTPGTEPNSPGWQVRIVSNKFPALASASNTSPICNEAIGIHEVIIECPQSETHITNLDLAQFKLIFQIYRDRLQQLAENGDVAHATIFKNQGPAAGASLSHTHSQLMATAFVPPLIQQELSFTANHFDKTNQDYFEELLTTELACGKRIVEQTDDYVVLCPTASRFSFEMSIYPRIAQSHFHLTDRACLDNLASVMRRVLRRLEKVANQPDYNFVLHSAPFAEKTSPGFRWHWEIYPRLSGIAGWELGAGSYVNSLFPETAARKLRETLID